MQFMHGKFAQTSPDTNALQAVHILKVASYHTVHKPDHPTMTRNPEITGTPSAACTLRGSVDRRIRAFLNGESHGEDVLGALYGHVADEPLPDRLRRLLKY